MSFDVLGVSVFIEAFIFVLILIVDRFRFGFGFSPHLTFWGGDDFGNEFFSLFKHNHFIGTSVLCDDLYKLKLDGFYAEII